MAERVVDLLQSVEVKKQEGELTRGSLRTLDFGVHGVDQVTVVGKTGERVLGCLLAEMVLEFALLGDVLDDNLVAVLLSFAGNLASTEADLEGRAVLALPFDFQRTDRNQIARVTE